MLFEHDIKEIKKRDGRIVLFDKNRIAGAVAAAMRNLGEGDLVKDPGKIAEEVAKKLARKFPRKYIPTVEDIQDMTEEVLILSDLPKTAKSYILYRNERARIRQKRREIPEHLNKLVQDSKKYFRHEFAEFIYFRTYSRWIENEGRRETWTETISRYMDFMKENLGQKLTEEEYKEIETAILNQEVMPSMRLLWSAGKAAKATNVAAYNCSFIAPRELKDFGEIMYLLMCGTGVGFSVESQTVQELPIVKRQTGKKLKTFIIEDNKEGWGEALTFGLKTWYEGKDVAFNYSKLRAAGARLNTMGGRSSGPEPLVSLLEFSRYKVLSRQGKRLSNIDVHDIVCKIGEIVVAGGVRRSALISLSDLDDEEMRRAKEGQFYLTQPQRAMANNSAVYHQKPSAKEFLDEWLALAKSGTGERGIFNRGGLEFQLPKRRWEKFEKHRETSGTNPCGEIILRSKQFCNLTEVVARPLDTEGSLLRKIRLATILGTYQSTLTNFPYLSREWRKNCEEERLLGVSITGQWDSRDARDPRVLRRLREKAKEVNEEYANKFGVHSSACITCVKPSGTVSQLVDVSSGMHPRHAPYYIRRVRISASDPLFQMIKEQKYPYHPEVGQTEDMATTFVLEFPIASPQGSVFKNDLKAINQLKHWQKVKENYTEHNPSVTISVGDEEWIDVANWIYNNWEMIGGLSFLPRADHVYKLAPYEEITQERYKKMKKELPEIDFSQIVSYEKRDETTGAKELACVSGTCEL